jgi:hypothetical protein
MDTLFHSRIAKVEAMVGDIKSEVQLAVQDVLEEVAKVSDIQVGCLGVGPRKESRGYCL